MDTKKEQDEGRRAPDAGEAADGSQGNSAPEAKPAVGSPLGLLDMSTDLRRYLVSTPLARMPTGELYREPESLDATFDETKRNTRSEFNPANYREVLEAERQRRAERQPQTAETHGDEAESRGSATHPGVAPESAPRANQDQTTLIDGRKRQSKRATVGVVALLVLMVLGMVTWVATQGSRTVGSEPLVTGAESELPAAPVTATDPSPLEATRPTAPGEDTPASTGVDAESRDGDGSVARAPAKESKSTGTTTSAPRAAQVEVETQQKSPEPPRSNRKVEQSGARPSALPFQAKP